MTRKHLLEIAESLLSMALNEGNVVYNDYLDGSIKSAERENRGEGSGSEFHNLQADQQ